MTLLYESGLNKLGDRVDYYGAVKFYKHYNTYYKHASLSINMFHEPQPFDYGGGEGGFPPEYTSSIGVGSINADANPIIIWTQEVIGDFNQVGFQTVNPRPDLGKREVYINKFTLQRRLSADNYTRSKTEARMDIFEAVAKLEKLSWAYFRPKYDAAVMRIRETKHAERLKNREGMEERFAKQIREADERIKLGTSVPEDWEIKI